MRKQSKKRTFVTRRRVVHRINNAASISVDSTIHLHGNLQQLAAGGSQRGTAQPSDSVAGSTLVSEIRGARHVTVFVLQIDERANILLDPRLQHCRRAILGTAAEVDLATIADKQK
jgi:hypothetical protein